MAQLSDFFRYSDVQLAPITEADITETVALVNAAYAYQDAYKLSPRTNPTHLRQTAIDKELYVARQHNKIVGCVYVKYIQDIAHFGLLAVAEPLRGRGLGSALIAAVEAYAQNLGAKIVELDYMSAAPQLKTYYEKHGYTETGEIAHWGNIDLIRMAKLLH